MTPRSGRYVNTDRTTSTLPIIVAAMHADITAVDAITSALGRLTARPEVVSTFSSVTSLAVPTYSPAGSLVVIRADISGSTVDSILFKIKDIDYRAESGKEDDDMLWALHIVV